MVLAEGTAQAKSPLDLNQLEAAGHKYLFPCDRCEPTSPPPGPRAGRWLLPLSRRRREMSSNKEQRSAVFVILFALITILILYSSNSANEVFHYGSLRGRSRRPINLKKWSITDGYVPILGNKTLPSRCHQCVIVTSSSHLLGTKLGPEIERAECTIRMNDAPTTGYSADVGNKTTFRVVAHSSVYRVLKRPQEFVNRTPETVFIFWGPPTKMQKPQGSLVRIIQRAGLVFPNMEAYAVSPGRMRQFDDLFRGETGKDREKSHSWLSTGWFTMVIAVELCDHVHVYGMVPPDYCSGPVCSACPTTTTNPRGRTSVSPTSRMSTAARATTTASSPRRGSSRPGRSCTGSPSPIPPGPRPPRLWGPHTGHRRSGFWPSHATEGHPGQ
ncbi:alpha-N-acetylgalactosaminide alpha-2,6-sialyltransferase 6 isoform X1 [Eptesicus fuscus]|uniref:alpha-N-acetylgalactosaminide alpha-2,6-sialyltransferase 6 isoform X1 n=2 Tax=Eptesicus fuscus TaxID=29078 RepID=UPI002404898B|nr:alpha-N-acetylgalactosaminide alpha-2,6-sialyltransferase 6 isoform X1 [Eptesicus fuscus]XP_054583429.1 alpha-N-acetylgalactosaminide alpha-2,6-sialyltransferase 6 isoform X1 [Eptesicus fuscus]XP_054583430.1 alpha-N-acetylgalactosaminide alpha-2,6-sialyltransferase 6 isoform X1 [Eptesicus fuscus]XP_054583431.1 alpha-N-acetylgalactosaminide alpha-2,6-sialyltransferase 6 isoform X1 [Eptesicus fuscus]